MVFTDMPLEQLRAYRPEVREPEDFDRFWTDTLTEARAAGGDPSVTRWDGPGNALEMFDVTFPGFGGEPIRAWLVQPADITEPLPCLVQFQGYGGSRGLPPLPRMFATTSTCCHISALTPRVTLWQITIVWLQEQSRKNQAAFVRTEGGTIHGGDGKHL